MRRAVVASLMLLAVLPAAARPGAEYAVVVSADTLRDPAWAAVVGELEAGRRADRVVWSGSVTGSLARLREIRPRYACFVARPAEVSREFVAQVHRITRALDDDPWGDCLWGILTGFDAANARAIARTRAPLTVRRALGGTAISLDRFDSGIWFDEGRVGHAVEKDRYGGLLERTVPPDTTSHIVEELNRGDVDLVVTSGHATEREWQIGYTYTNGSLRSHGGRLYGVDTKGRRFEVRSPNPKVYLPVGNCLMGHMDGPDAMALAWMNAAGVRQMIGYTVPTWFGYMGWGVLDYFVEQPGRFTLAEAVFANQQALLRELQLDPHSRGHRFDRDVVAFYGDPAWEARLAPRELDWEQGLEMENDVWTFTVRPRRGEASFRRGTRPFFQWLPQRIRAAHLIEGREWQPVIADDILLVPRPPSEGPAQPIRVVFRVVPDSDLCEGETR